GSSSTDPADCPTLTRHPLVRSPAGEQKANPLLFDFALKGEGIVALLVFEFIIPSSFVLIIRLRFNINSAHREQTLILQKQFHMDAKDILGLPKNGPLMSQEKKSRPQKESQRKPDGISREITWQWLPFTSSARKDNLQLYHWAELQHGVPPTGDYSFAKYNKSVDVLEYTDEEYEKFLSNFHGPRKRRINYLIFARGLHPLPMLLDIPFVKDPTMFLKIERNVHCRWCSHKQSCKSVGMQRFVHTVLAEAKRISESRKAAKAAEETELLDVSVAAPEGAEKAAGIDVISTAPSAQLPSGIVAPPVSETAHLASLLRCQISLNLQKQLQYKEAEGSSYREGSYSETPVRKELGKRDQKRKGPDDYQKFHLHQHSQNAQVKDL
ncbi:hypothetical protein HAX54_051928, partial [Datura stramonium]|nr:hypothetical protein [Datura stramonium]